MPRNIPRKILDWYIADRLDELVNDMYLIGQLMYEEYAYLDDGDAEDSHENSIPLPKVFYVVIDNKDMEEEESDALDDNFDASIFPLSRQILSEKFLIDYFSPDLEHMEKTLRELKDIRIYIQKYSQKQKGQLVREIYAILQDIQTQGGNIEYISYWIFELLGLSDIYPNIKKQKRIEKICDGVLQKAKSVL